MIAAAIPEALTNLRHWLKSDTFSASVSGHITHNGIPLIIITPNMPAFQTISSALRNFLWLLLLEFFRLLISYFIKHNFLYHTSIVTTFL